MSSFPASAMTPTPKRGAYSSADEMPIVDAMKRLIRAALLEPIPVAPLIDIIIQYSTLIPLTMRGLPCGESIQHCAIWYPPPAAAATTASDASSNATGSGVADIASACLLFTDSDVKRRVQCVELATGRVTTFSTGKMQAEPPTAAASATASTAASTASEAAAGGGLEVPRRHEGVTMRLPSLFGRPWGIAAHDRSVYVSDSGKHVIFRLSPATADATASGGDAFAATSICGISGKAGNTDGAVGVGTLNYPRGIAVSSDGQFLVVGDKYGHAIRKLELTSGALSTVGGFTRRSTQVDGDRNTSSVGYPKALCFHAGGTLDAAGKTIEPDRYVFIAAFESIRRLDITTGELTSVPLPREMGRAGLNAPEFQTGLDNKKQPNPRFVHFIAGTNYLIAGTTDTMYSVNTTTGDARRLTLANGGRYGNGEPDIYYPTAVLFVAGVRDSVDRLYVCDQSRAPLSVISGNIFPVL